MAEQATQHAGHRREISKLNSVCLFFHSSRAHFSCAGLDIRIHSTRTNAPGRTSSFFLFVAKLEGRNEVHHVLEVAFGVEVFSAANLGHGRVIVLANADADDGRVLYGDK